MTFFPNLGNIPKLRFSEFTEEWEERYISEVISSKSKKYNPENSDSNYRSIELESLSQDSGELLSTFDSKNQKSIKNVFNSGDVLFGKLRPYLKKYYLADFDGVCSSEIWVLKSSILDSDYLYAFVQSNSFISLTEKSSGSKMPRADWNLVSSSLIVYPSNTNERKKIGKTIQLINSRIQTQKKIISQLKSQMSNLKDLIFEQKLRFTDDKENEFPDWQESRLEDICEKQSSNISANKIEDNMGDYPIYGATGILKNIDFYEVENDYISIIKDGAGVGRLLYCEGKSSVLGTLDIIQSKNINLYFIFLLLSRIDFKKYITGSTIPHIYFKDYKKEKFQIPSIEEQEKIANFFKSLDEKINLETELLTQYENQKKYLLQNLFV
ncbi:restriction endonuclease subunit S [Flavobacterium lindanitolerans]|uniref:restriction endonuclease subunit S n=1 Tax=Flavobacterium lindanitolerans TaxID=428988 RepID=UPI0023F33BAC|nr:restriction endonuclease subunit S [Flavobacterium lindanitolerans]